MSAHPSSARPWVTAIAASISVAACTTARTPVRTVDPSLHVGTMGATNRFEREMRRPVDTDAASGSKDGKVTPALFWTGTALAAVGAAGTIGFGIAGGVMDRKIEDGFDNDMTHEEFDRYNDLGDSFNTAMIVSGAVGLVGLTLAAIVYGADYTRCGPMAPKRRKCKSR